LQNEVGKGAFQEHDQCTAASQYVKLSIQAKSINDIPKCITRAYENSLQHGFGPCYVDIPSNIFMCTIENYRADVSPSAPSESKISEKILSKVLGAVRNAKRCDFILT